MGKSIQTLASLFILSAVNCLGANTVYLEIRNGQPIASGVYVNGQGPYRFLIDTGSTLNHLDARLAVKIGLGETFRTSLLSCAGRASVTGATGIDVSVNSAVAHNQTFLFTLASFHDVWPDIEGILGEDFLSHFDYMLDIRARRLVFGPPESSREGTRIPYRIDHGRPVVATNLGWLVVDSGASRVTRFRQRAFPTAEMATATGKLAVGMVHCTLKIGEHTLWSGEAVAVSRAVEPGLDGMLPVRVFKSIYVSNSGGYMVFE
jgi:hypothetical protein